MRHLPLAVVVGVLVCVTPTPRAQSNIYDVVIRNGRVLDPDSGLDAVRSIGVHDGKIAAISAAPLRGTPVIEARGLVVAPTTCPRFTPRPPEQHKPCVHTEDPGERLTRATFTANRKGKGHPRTAGTSAQTPYEGLR